MEKFCLKSILINILVFMSLQSFSQGQKFAFVEGLGSGVLVNLNFDMRMNKESREGFGFKVGIGNTSIYLDENVTTLPLGINYIFGKQKSGLLLGANATVAFGDSEDYDEIKHFVPSLEIGYRFRPISKGFAFQVTYNPIFNTVDGFKPLWFGVGLGYSW